MVRCSKVCRCSRAASALPERWRARARPNWADACRRLQTQHSFELGNGFGVLLQLRVHRSQEVVGVGIVGIDLQDALKCVDGFGRLALTAPQETQVVPDARIGGFFGCRRVEGRFCFGQLLEIQQGDSLVQFGGCQVWVGFQRLVEFLHCFVHALLVHVGDAEIVQLGCLGVIRWLVAWPCAHRNQTNHHGQHNVAQDSKHSESLLVWDADGEAIIAAAIPFAAPPFRQTRTPLRWRKTIGQRVSSRNNAFIASGYEPIRRGKICLPALVKPMTAKFGIPCDVQPNPRPNPGASHVPPTGNVHRRQPYLLDRASAIIQKY